jgi:type VI secretion system protein ImpB
MAQKGSVAPKERVNITYRPATGDAREEVELPLKVLVMGDFTMREEDAPVEERSAVNVDKNNFEDVLAAHDVRFSGLVPNKISGEPDAQLSVDLDFKSLKDLEPDAIVQNIPELRNLLELRNALKSLKVLGNKMEFKRKLKEMVQDESIRDRLLKELGLNE